MLKQWHYVIGETQEKILDQPAEVEVVVDQHNQTIPGDARKDIEKLNGSSNAQILVTVLSPDTMLLIAQAAQLTHFFPTLRIFRVR